MKVNMRGLEFPTSMDEKNEMDEIEVSLTHHEPSFGAGDEPDIRLALSFSIRLVCSSLDQFNSFRTIFHLIIPCVIIDIKTESGDKTQRHLPKQLLCCIHGPLREEYEVQELRDVAQSKIARLRDPMEPFLKPGAAPQQLRVSLFGVEKLLEAPQAFTTRQHAGSVKIIEICQCHKVMIAAVLCFQCCICFTHGGQSAVAVRTGPESVDSFGGQQHQPKHARKHSSDVYQDCDRNLGSGGVG